jgi:DNA-binding MarR family transcriptional regulator
MTNELFKMMKSAKQEMLDEKIATTHSAVIFWKLLEERIINYRQKMILDFLLNFSMRGSTLTNIRKKIGFDSDAIKADIQTLMKMGLIQKQEKPGEESDFGTLYRIESVKPAYPIYDAHIAKKKMEELNKAKELIKAKE